MTRHNFSGGTGLRTAIVILFTIGTIRRECLDWMIPISESQLRQILKLWVGHYNRGRPHSRLGPGVPDPPARLPDVKIPKRGHCLGEDVIVLARSVLGGLHHEYSLASLGR